MLDLALSTTRSPAVRAVTELDDTAPAARAPSGL